MTRRRVRRIAALATVATAPWFTVGGPGIAAALDTPVGEVITLPPAGEACVGAAPTRAAGAPWALRRLAPQHIWPLTRGSGVVVAILDTGVSAAAPSLAGAVWPGRDVVATGTADSDCAGRGTALAGIVAARPVSGSPFVGLAPDAEILPIRITDSRGQLNAQTLADGISAAVAGGARVILVGAGLPADTDELRAAVQAAVQAGAVIVAPVNSQGPANGRPPAVWYPAAYPDVIGVGDADIDGLSLVTLPMPGCDLLAPGSGSISIAPVGDGHYAVGGSPVAAAHVAGVAALIRAYYPALPPSAVRERLLATAESLPGRPPVLDAYAAVSATGPTVAVTATGDGGWAIVVPTPDASPKPGRAATFVATVVALLLVTVLAVGAGRASQRRKG